MYVSKNTSNHRMWDKNITSLTLKIWCRPNSDQRDKLMVSQMWAKTKVDCCHPQLHFLKIYIAICSI